MKRRRTEKSSRVFRLTIFAVLEILILQDLREHPRGFFRTTLIIPIVSSGIKHKNPGFGANFALATLQIGIHAGPDDLRGLVHAGVAPTLAVGLPSCIQSPLRTPFGRFGIVCGCRSSW